MSVGVQGPARSCIGVDALRGCRAAAPTHRNAQQPSQVSDLIPTCPPCHSRESRNPDVPAPSSSLPPGEGEQNPLPRWERMKERVRPCHCEPFCAPRQEKARQSLHSPEITPLPEIASSSASGELLAMTTTQGWETRGIRGRWVADSTHVGMSPNRQVRSRT